jgi:hypothetical protein
VLVACGATAAFGGLAITVLALLDLDQIGFAILASIKVVYGTLVALVVTPVALRAALRDA